MSFIAIYFRILVVLRSEIAHCFFPCLSGYESPSGSAYQIAQLKMDSAKPGAGEKF